MKRALIILILFAAILIPFSHAAPNLDIQKVDKGSVILSELDNPAKFEFVVENNGDSDMFEIYSLINVAMTPKGLFTMTPGVNRFEVTASPGREFRKNPGFFNFEYEIQGRRTGILKDTLLLKIVSIKDVLEIKGVPVSQGDTEVTIKIRNKENTHLADIEVRLESQFFEGTKTVSLEPYQEISVSLGISKDIRKLSAGPYIIKGVIEVEGKEAGVEGLIDYLEKEGTSVQTENSGFLVRSKTIVETNEGNTPTTSIIEVRKNIISRLFTTYSLEPEQTIREGFVVTYRWSKPLSPAESFSVKSTTNYVFPFVLAILIVLIGFFVKVYSQTSVALQKQVHFVKTSSGEFALKVSIRVKARKHVDKVQLIDSLPRMTQLYEKFGRKPDRIDANTGRLFWNIGSMNRGEERSFYYIIYSKLRVVGRFELPASTAIYEKEGRTQEVWSNRAFFASEMARK